MAGDAYRVQEFVEDAKRIVGRCEGPESTVQFLGPLLERLVSRPDCLADLGGSASPDESFDIHRADRHHDPGHCVAAQHWRSSP